MSPRDRLAEGAILLGAVLRPHGFEFAFCAEGRDLVGEFAEGEFIRDDRRLAPRFRRSRSLATYQVGPALVTLGGYMAGVGAREYLTPRECLEDPLAGFLRLASEIRRYAGHGPFTRKACAHPARGFTVRRKEDSSCASFDTRFHSR